MFLKFSQYEGINGVISPLGCINQGNGCLRRIKGPVLFIFRTFRDPLVEQIFLCLGQGGMGFGRRHDFIGIIGMDAVVKFTVLN